MVIVELPAPAAYSVSAKSTARAAVPEGAPLTSVVWLPAFRRTNAPLSASIAYTDPLPLTATAEGFMPVPKFVVAGDPVSIARAAPLPVPASASVPFTAPLVAAAVLRTPGCAGVKVTGTAHSTVLSALAAPHVAMPSATSLELVSVVAAELALLCRTRVCVELAPTAVESSAVAPISRMRESVASAMNRLPKLSSAIPRPLEPPKVALLAGQPSPRESVFWAHTAPEVNSLRMKPVLLSRYSTEVLSPT